MVDDSSWVGREDEQRRLAWMLGGRLTGSPQGMALDDASHASPASSSEGIAGVPLVLVHGPEATGKTRIVKSCVASLGMPWAYTSGRICQGMARNVMQACVEDLTHQGWIRSKSSKLATQGGGHGQHAAAVNTCADMLALLDASDLDTRRTAYWVIDDADVFSQTTSAASEDAATSASSGEAKAKFVTFLLQLGTLLKHRKAIDATNAGASHVYPKLCVVLVSRCGWDCFQSAASHEGEGQSVCQTAIYFPPYDVAQMVAILSREPPTPADATATAAATATAMASAWSRFVQVLVPSVSQYTSSIHIMRYLAHKMFPMYRKCCREEGEDEGAGGAYLAFKPQLQVVLRHMRSRGTVNVQALAEYFQREDVHGDAGLCGDVDGNGSVRKFVANLPYMSKMILIAAYIAGWNPTSADDSLFHSGRKMGRKRPRKDAMASTRKSIKMFESKMMGPGTFSFERLTSILKALLQLEGDGDGDEDCDGDGSLAKVYCVETFTQVKTLMSMSILSSANANDGTIHCDNFRMQCNLKEDVAVMIAKTIGVALQDYLMYTRTTTGQSAAALQ